MADEVPVRAAIAARNRERQRLSNILHDEIAGGLTAAGLSLDLLALDAPPEFDARIREIQGMLERGFEAVRDLSREFHPDPAVRFHLVPAIESLALRFGSRFCGTLKVQLSKEIEARAIGPEQARAYYAVLDAALDNIERHAGAQHVSIVLEGGPESVAQLTIRDDGKGFHESTARTGTGTAVMEYHVRVAGLRLLVQSWVGRGTMVRVSPSEGVQKIKKKRGSHEDGY